MAHERLGLALQQQGKLDAAVESYLKALANKPDYAEAHNNLGLALNDQGKFDAAEDLPVVVHTFSHYRLHLQVLVQRVDGLQRDHPTLRWVAAADLSSLGLPAPIRKLLDTGAPPARPKRRTMRGAPPSPESE